MADRKVHYEAAFEAYLRDRGIPYVAVDEAKRALFSTAKLKSFDFVVYSKVGPNLLVDVKGRSCRDRSLHKGFETWATEQDVEDLGQWTEVFGAGFTALFAFVYWIDPPMLPEPAMFEFRDRWYLMVGVSLPEYRDHMRRRSERWRTVSLKTDDFRALARPINQWLSSANADGQPIPLFPATRLPPAPNPAARPPRSNDPDFFGPARSSGE